MRVNIMLLITDTEWNYIIIIKKLKYTFRKKKTRKWSGRQNSSVCSRMEEHLWEPTIGKKLTQCVIQRTKVAPMGTYNRKATDTMWHNKGYSNQLCLWGKNTILKDSKLGLMEDTLTWCTFERWYLLPVYQKKT